MPRIGVISDTHGYLDEKVSTYFNDCHEIWHAGDIGSPEIVNSLNNITKTRCVWGNIDGNDIKVLVPEHQIFELEGKKILITHIAGKPGKYSPEARELIRKERPDILVCGHSHILRVMNDKKENLLFINPGAAGKQGFHKVKTLIKFDLKDGVISEMKAIEMKR